MSFPHRTAFYDQDDNEIVFPEDVGKKGGYEHPIVSHPEGKGLFFPYESENGESKYIPLASTGLEDSGGNEIFEGHIVGNENDKGTYPPAVVIYGRGTFSIKFETGRDFLSVVQEGKHRENVKIIGHALTDPELVPDSFDVEGYFS